MIRYTDIWSYLSRSQVNIAVIDGLCRSAGISPALRFSVFPLTKGRLNRTLINLKGFLIATVKGCW